MSENKKAVNYMTWKDDDLISRAKDLEIDHTVFMEDDKLNRKFLVNMIKFAEIKKGKGDEAMIENADGSIEGIASKARHVKVIFHNSDENDLPYVQLGLNGRAYYIPRNVEVWLPKPVLDGPVKDAIMHKMKTVTDKYGNIEQQYKSVPRYVYQVIDMK